MTLTALLVLVVFLLGIYFYATYDASVEGFGTQQRCPDMLIQKGAKFYLYNSRLAQVPGVNPIEFANLEDYSEFLDWQRSQGIRCPVLYLQSTFDAQGAQVYKVRPSVSDPQFGLPPSTPSATVTPMPSAATADPTPESVQPATDPAASTASGALSGNAMDANWGGKAYTEKLIDNGYYAADEVTMPGSN